MDLSPVSGMSVSTLRTPLAPATKDLRTAAEGFEALFLTELLKGGRAGLPGDDLTNSQGVRMATDMLDTHLAQHAAGFSRLGVADAIMRQFGGALDKP